MGNDPFSRPMYSLCFTNGVKFAPEKVAAVIGFIDIAQIGGLIIALAISAAVLQNIAFMNLSEILSLLRFSAEDVHDAVDGSDVQRRTDRGVCGPDSLRGAGATPR